VLPLQDHQALQEKLDHQALQEATDHQDRKVMKDHEDLKVSLVCPLCIELP
jgi:hypothetical protein